MTRGITHAVLFALLIVSASSQPVCTKCGIDNNGKKSCCGVGGAWNGNCGNNKKYKWQQGINACSGQNKNQNQNNNKDKNTGKDCKKCAKLASGQLSCCAPDGEWEGECGAPGKKTYTWQQGVDVCDKKKDQPDRPDRPTTGGKCKQCGKLASGKLSCCAEGGSWTGKCGSPGSKEHTWTEGIDICKGKDNRPEDKPKDKPNDKKCDKCVKLSNGKLSCCANGGAWNGHCGTKANGKAFTWAQGIDICKGKDQGPSDNKCKCGKTSSGASSCCAPDGSWSGQCGGKAQGKAHTWIEGENACKGNKDKDKDDKDNKDKDKDDKDKDNKDKDNKSNKDTKCKECGKLANGKSSCCGDGGTWKGNCGGSKDHTWTEGIDACQGNQKVKLDLLPMPKACAACGLTGTKIRNCCAIGGSWEFLCKNQPNKADWWEAGKRVCAAKKSNLGNQNDASLPIAAVWQSTGCTCGDEIKQGQKTGRRSCCGEGGSWYNLCGMYDGVKQPHTWNEGLQACRDASQQNQNNKQSGKKPGKNPKPKPEGNKDKKLKHDEKPGKKPGKNPKPKPEGNKDKKLKHDENPGKKPKPKPGPSNNKNNNNNNNVWQGTGCTCGDEIKQGQRTGRLSCCGEGGSWYNLCGMYDGVKQPHTWNEGLQACRGASQQNQNNKQPGKKPGKKPGKDSKPKPEGNKDKDKKPKPKPKPGPSNNNKNNNNNNNNNVWQGTGCTCGDEIKQGQKTGRLSCCGEGGSWYNLCGMYDGVKQPHTWNEGLQACRGASQQNQNNKQPGKKPGKKPGKNPKPKPEGNKDKKPGKKPGDKSNKPGKKPGKEPKNGDRTKFDLNLGCNQCGTLASGTRSCCGTGGSWQGTCGTAAQVAAKSKSRTWVQGIEACAASFLRGSGGAETNRAPDASIARHVSASFRDGVAFLAGFACLLISSNVIA